MPKILEDAVNRIRAKGASKSSAYAIATKTLQKAGELKPGTRTATPKGVKRGNMTRAERHSKPV
jgi:hypothetical protein